MCTTLYTLQIPLSISEAIESGWLHPYIQWDHTGIHFCLKPEFGPPVYKRCSFEISLHQQDFRVAHRCDLHCRFHCDFTQKKSMQVTMKLAKKQCRKLFSESQLFEPLHWWQWGVTCHGIWNWIAPVWTGAECHFTQGDRTGKCSFGNFNRHLHRCLSSRPPPYSDWNATLKSCEIRSSRAISMWTRDEA